MFTASIAFIWEVENKTITLLKLSNLNPIEYLLGVSSVQTIIGVVAAFLSLGTAIALGFSVGGSIDSMYVGGTQNNISIIVTIFIVSALTSISILTIIYLIIGAILFKKRHYGLLSHARKG